MCTPMYSPENACDETELVWRVLMFGCFLNFKYTLLFEIEADENSDLSIYTNINDARKCLSLPYEEVSTFEQK